MNLRRDLAWGGVIGPTAFVAAWATAGALTKGYSPVQQSISRLAAVHAPKRRLMTAGFVCFGVAVPAYGLALRGSLGGRSWLAATASGVATLGAGAFALNTSSAIDRAHYGLAVVASSSLALTPILAAQAFRRVGTAGVRLLRGSSASSPASVSPLRHFFRLRPLATHRADAPPRVDCSLGGCHRRRTPGTGLSYTSEHAIGAENLTYRRRGRETGGPNGRATSVTMAR